MSQTSHRTMFVIASPHKQVGHSAWLEWLCWVACLFSGRLSVQLRARESVTFQGEPVWYSTVRGEPRTTDHDCLHNHALPGEVCQVISRNRLVQGLFRAYDREQDRQSLPSVEPVRSPRRCRGDRQLGLAQTRTTRAFEPCSHWTRDTRSGAEEFLQALCESGDVTILR